MIIGCYLLRTLLCLIDLLMVLRYILDWLSLLSAISIKSLLSNTILIFIEHIFELIGWIIYLFVKMFNVKTLQVLLIQWHLLAVYTFVQALI